MEFVIQHLLWTTIVMMLVSIILVVLVVWLVHWMAPETPTRTPMAMAVVSILVAAIFGVALNNLYALKRDRDGRKWNMQQQHLAQLRPVLKQEADQIAGLADSFHRVGFLEGEHGGFRTSASEMASFFEPNVMSFDLASHYPEYTKSKSDLEAAVEKHDREFSSAVTEVQMELGVHDISWFSAETLAKTFVTGCIGRGAGFTMRVIPNGPAYTFSIYGSEHSNSGKPTPDLLYAYSRYRSFMPSQKVRDKCSLLRTSADTIEREARDLSRTAVLLGQETTLRGECQFVKLD